MRADDRFRTLNKSRNDQSEGIFISAKERKWRGPKRNKMATGEVNKPRNDEADRIFISTKERKWRGHKRNKRETGKVNKSRNDQATKEFISTKEGKWRGHKRNKMATGEVQKYYVIIYRDKWVEQDDLKTRNFKIARNQVAAEAEK